MKRLQSPLEVLKMSYEDIPRSLRKGVLENMKIKRSDAFRSILDVLMYMEMSGTLKDEGLRGSFENVSRLDMKCVARDGIDQLRRNSQRLVSARNRLGVRWCSMRENITYLLTSKKSNDSTNTGTLQVITRERFIFLCVGTIKIHQGSGILIVVLNVEILDQGLGELL